MEWLNIYGLIFMALITAPNIVYAFSRKGSAPADRAGKWLETVEQVGRFGCFGFMIFNIPGTWFGWPSNEAFAVYLVLDTLLVVLYCVLWILLWRKDGIFKALALSVIPSAIFLFSGIMSRSVLLIIAALLFAPSHICISCQNADRT